MVQCRGLHFPQNYLALCSGLALRVSNAQRFWRLSRLYASTIKDTTANQKLIYQIRAYQKENVTIPWYILTGQYRMTVDSMKQILAQDDARICAQKELSVRVTQRADQLYDNDRGRCDWETLAKEFDKPLMECLVIYDTSLSTIATRSRPRLTDWPAEDIETLRAFVAAHVYSNAVDNIRLVEVYMNVIFEDCIPVLSMLSYPKMTTDLFEAIKQCRNSGMKWATIHTRYPFWCGYNALSRAFRRFNNGPSQKSAKCDTIKWNESETTRIQEIVNKHYRLGDLKRVLEIAIGEFSDKPKYLVEWKVTRICYATQRPSTDCNGVRWKRLMDAHGENWKQIGARMGITAKKVLFLWIKNEQLLKRIQIWTESETDIIRNCIKDGTGPVEASRLVGTKSVYSCARKMDELENPGQRDAHQRYWSLADDMRLTVLASAYNSMAIDWEHISKELGRRISACKQVGQTVGLSERECLEICQFSEGKTRWIYDPDTFSWDAANKMTGFIEANYPSPTPVNYRAVSNYMWVDINDCIHMAMLLRGEIQWTDKIVERIVELRKQGMQFKYIAKQLSPNLDENRVFSVYHNKFSRKTWIPISDEDKQLIKHLLDKHAEHMPYKKLTPFIVERLTSGDKSTQLTRIARYAMGHPVYKARLEKAGKTKVMNQLLAGTASTKELAVKLDIPSTLLVSLRNVGKARMCSVRWTYDETEQLIAHVQENTPPYNWKLFSLLLGTKSSEQIALKHYQLRVRGKL
ncbi:hypothetical protein COEREDRAFT_10615 [Coemansia reversa NRRL 1564]|uniref:Myb-like domain-containing protein n=1 Tax=Coemansia reversa (strain ATCC 12441 / NRRL 1564) TaxID=763665 RepID=A0A2G5B5H7_COERN|nr:hypothetical protein COEREDRAFT_10615 [Coemansia reversa NRRL 1564]|eukprot:PIA14259.1 hypothetical protein COEREDRAFT_10615 [Coemansia reversa NRRL 1564]